MSGNGTDLVETKTCVNLNDAVEVTEEDRHGKEEDVDGVTNEVAYDLDAFAGGDPHGQHREGRHPEVVVPRRRHLEKEIHKEEVADDGRRGEGRKVQRIRAPGLPSSRGGPKTRFDCQHAGHSVSWPRRV